MSSSEVHRLPSCELQVERTGFVTRPTSSFISAVIIVATIFILPARQHVIAPELVIVLCDYAS